MKRIIYLLISISLLYSCSNSKQKDNYPPLPNTIKNIEKGINVTISPDTIYAELSNDSISKYIWKYKTSVSSINKTLTIKEFGAYVYFENKWYLATKERIPYNLNDFEKWYSCKNGILEKGKTYTDPKNWGRNDILDNTVEYEFWYYIGVDSNNKEYIGIGKLYQKPKLKDK